MLGSSDASEAGPGSGRIGLQVAVENERQCRDRTDREAVVHRDAAPNRRALASKVSHR